MIINPFIVGQPVPTEKFVGRVTQINSAFDQIHHRGNLAVWGGPGMGKTSFLEYLTQPQTWQFHGQNPDAAVTVLLNCLSIVPFNSSNFWRQVFKQIQAKLALTSPLQAILDTLLQRDQSSVDDLMRVLRGLGQQDQFLLLLLDDYDRVFRAEGNYTQESIRILLNECRNIANIAEERQYLSMIVATSRRLNELGPALTLDESPWFNHFLYRQLKPLTEAEADELLVELTLTAELRDGIREIADGNPALLQQAGFLLHEQLRVGNHPSAPAFAQDFQVATLHIFESTWLLLNDLEQSLMMLIALDCLAGRIGKKVYSIGNVEIIFSQHEPELQGLISRGIIRYTAGLEQLSYRFNSSMMERWVIQQIQTCPDQELQARQKMFLRLMSHQQAQQMTQAIQWVWHHRDQLPSVLEWVGQVASALPKGMLKG
jgi:hypothetical protein